MTTVYDILVRPLVTEKTNYQTGKLRQVTFEVHKDANKAMIKDAIELVFGVKVQRVNVIQVAPKRGRHARSRQMRIRKSGYKKALVTLMPGETIDIFEGVK
ncbi:MAG: 50S ribosomal protein L23 [Anaerolineales bacterium]|jgi:large subunit ribosomal protein L23|nr:50S ribosomal protein L23 [Anaerolineales bacterium]MBX3004196.1 50S ribosomal protein L23 [Anaerolineales bacterium]